MDPLPYLEKALGWLILRRRFRITRMALYPDRHGFELALMPEIENRTNHVYHLERALLQFYWRTSLKRFFSGEGSYSAPFEVRLLTARIYHDKRRSDNGELLPGEKKVLYLADDEIGRRLHSQPEGIRLTVPTREGKPFVGKWRLRWAHNTLGLDEIHFWREGIPEEQDPAPDGLTHD